MTFQFIAIQPHLIRLPFRTPFKTATQILTHRELMILHAQIAIDGDVFSGIGEVQSFSTPFYTAETLQQDWQSLMTNIIPQLLQQNFTDIENLANWLTIQIPDLPFLRAGIEMIAWDATGKATQQSLAQMIGATASTVPIGIALGLMESKQIDQKIAEGYQRIKLKVTEHVDGQQIRQLTHRYPDVQFSLDANQSWQKWSEDALRAVDNWGLRLVEQPFHVTDWQRHEWLQQQWQKTAVSLDESISTLADIQQSLTTVEAITLKQGKIGGLSTALTAIHLGQRQGQFMWVGGMVSSNIGRAVDIALAGLPKISDFPGDLSPSDRYFVEDVTKETFSAEQGRLTIPTQWGLGVRLDDQQLKKYCMTYEQLSTLV